MSMLTPAVRPRRAASAVVAGKTVGGKVIDGPRIGDDEAVEVPVVAQHIVEQPAIATCGNIVQVHVGAHDAADAGIYGGVERGQIDVL